MRDLQEVLFTEYTLGAELNGWKLDSATAISGDGMTIVGAGRDSTNIVRAWAVALTPPRHRSLAMATWTAPILSFGNKT